MTSEQSEKKTPNSTTESAASKSSRKPGPGEVCPVTGARLETVDDVAESLIRIKNLKDSLSETERAIKLRIASMATGEQTTQRVRGERHQIEVTKADVAWNGSALLDVWKTAPQPLASEILRIAEVAVNMRTWGVWQKTSGSEEFELWKKKIAEACRGRTGMPSVKVVPSSIQREDLF